MNNNLVQIKKWTVEILIAIILAIVIWLARSAFIERTNQLEQRVVKLERWIQDWYNVLKVPERDQNQDAQIQEFRQRIDRLEAWRDITQNPPP